ncbi:hypothetical protein VXE65_19130 [Mycolicibacterium conceptionense]|uniref:hypothetical protein n=1 Tax=Mycolicibacterium conceptionense TaxID=451644 RepID=UPI003204677E
MAEPLTGAGETQQGATGESEPAWQAGDIVLDSAGGIYQRASAEDIADGWAWCEGAEAALDKFGRTYVPEGSVDEHKPVRPLTLVVRDGRPVLLNS